MKKIAYIFLISSIIAACTSSQKLANSGAYDAAIEKSIRKLRKDKTKEKEIHVLETAYRKANEKDQERINYLKLEGNPDIWDKVFETYSRMKSRQDFVKTILPLEISSTKKAADIVIVNYDEEIVKAKQKAGEYFYAHAILLLEKKGRENGRQAFYELMKTKEYFPAYKDTERQLNVARSMGKSRVVFKIENKSRTELPQRMEDNLKKIAVADLNTEWVEYSTNADADVIYDFTINLEMKFIDVSPDKEKEIYYIETNDIPDGWQYLLDAKGNTVKDSTGKPIKVTKYKTVTCNVVEHIQSKHAIINGSLDYINNATGQLLKTEPVIAETHFENRFAMAFGDLMALKNETKPLLNRGPVPFPPETKMIEDAGSAMKDKVKSMTWNNKYLLK